MSRPWQPVPRAPPTRSDYRYDVLNQIGSERRESVKATFGPAILDCRILTFDETLFIEATLKCLHELLEWTGCRATEEPDQRQHPLLRVHRDRPGSGSGAKECNEFPPFHRLSSCRGLRGQNERISHFRLGIGPQVARKHPAASCPLWVKSRHCRMSA